MALAPTTYMLLVRPTPGADDDIWDDEANTAFGLVDGHRHIVGEGRQIPSAGINIDNPLSFNNFRITSVAGVAMQNLGAALTAGANEFFVTGGNAYFRNNAGTNVQLTSGATLNMTTVGGIAGDYTGVGAEVAFTDGTDTYTFKQQLGAGVRQYAKMQCGDIALTEYKAAPAGGVPANAVTFKSPAGLAGPYTLTMPAALPGVTRMLQVSAAGVITAGGNTAIDGTLSVSGLITATAGMTAAANQNVTLSGTGTVKHGDQIKTVNAEAMAVAIAANWTRTPGVLISTATDTAFLAPQFNVGDRVKSIKFAIAGDGAADVSIFAYSVATNGVSTTIGTVVVTNPGAAFADTTLDVTDTDITDSNAILVTFTPNAANINICNTRFTYDRP